MTSASHISPYVSLLSFSLGFPTLVATYLQAWKTRQESLEMRRSLASSSYCLEFVVPDGRSVNLMPLDSFNNLPRMGDVLLLPGVEVRSGLPQHGAYRVLRLEHLYTPETGRRALPGQIRLVKTVAYVDPLGARAEV